MIHLYNFLHLITWPILNIYLKRRIKKGKETSSSLKEKKANFSSARPKGKLVWFHAASVGESISLMPLVKKTSSSINTNILVTSGTLTSAALLRKNLPSNCTYQHLPYDRLSYVKKFLKHFSPDIAMFAESEIWPNFITEITKLKIPLFLISARISPKNSLEAKIHAFFLRSFFDKFSLIIPQDNYTKNYISKISPRAKITRIANLKKTGDALEIDKKKLEELKIAINKRQVFLAASTHEGEEEQILNCHTELRKNSNNLLTIIAPRHPHRSTDITKLCQEHNLSFAKRSQNNLITNNTEIYIADTLGELGLFYTLSKISFIGGSLSAIGGHNPFEAIRAGSAILHGPHIFNFQDIYHGLDKQNAALEVQNSNDLAKQVANLLTNQEKLAELIEAGKAQNTNNQEILEFYLKIIQANL